ncbi:hypothetical protein DPMN_075617 [Dreissena polymorpha]|uniref:Uncharacterized protein n=1 Tax=Dreissena polymorpha TaxID=45954 RepID=A0A9D3YKQ7_DREPO|nr:hypothetical protein DPMN_075617 [Dreissena polymorpha]
MTGRSLVRSGHDMTGPLPVMSPVRSLITSLVTGHVTGLVASLVTGPVTSPVIDHRSGHHSCHRSSHRFGPVIDHWSGPVTGRLGLPPITPVTGQEEELDLRHWIIC